MRLPIDYSKIPESKKTAFISVLLDILHLIARLKVLFWIANFSLLVQYSMKICRIPQENQLILVSGYCPSTALFKDF